MSHHTNHPDVHTHGLADACPACHAAAHDPLDRLDDDVLRDLLTRATDKSIPPSRSQAESIALRNLIRTLAGFGRLAKIEPGLALAYLTRWGVVATTDTSGRSRAREGGSDAVGTGGPA